MSGGQDFEANEDDAGDGNDTETMMHGDNPNLCYLCESCCSLIKHCMAFASVPCAHCAVG